MSSKIAAKSASLAWGDDFYKITRWRSLRRRALQLYGHKCHKCGEKQKKEKPLHVDHIKPRSKFPELAFAMTNLQILCEFCNTSKNNLNSNDYRPKQHVLLAEQYALNPNKLKQLCQERKVGVEELKRRREQSKQKKKNNPKISIRSRKQRKKEDRKFRQLQKQFLLEIQLAKQNNKKVEEVVDLYKKTHDNETIDQLIKLCKIEHWLKTA